MNVWQEVGRIVGGRITLIGALCVGACTCLSRAELAAQGAAPTWKGKVTRNGATVVVTNPALPMLSSGQYSVSPLWTAPSEKESARAGLWSEPVDVIASDVGYFVADSRALTFYKLERDGAWKISVGKGGTAPGEFSVLGGAAVASGELIVPVQSKLEVFSTSDGRHLRTVPMSSVTYAVASVRGSELLLSTTKGLERLSAAGQASPFAFFGDSPAGSTARPTSCSNSGVVNWLKVTLDCYLSRFSITDEKAVLRRVATARDTSRSTPGDAEACRKQQLGSLDPASLSESGRAMMERSLESCRIKQDVRSLRIDPVSGLIVLWRQNPESDTKVNASIEVYSREGIWLFSQPFQESWVAFAVHRSTLVALVRDNNSGLSSVTAYELTIPQEVLDRTAEIARAAGG